MEIHANAALSLKGRRQLAARGRRSRLVAIDSWPARSKSRCPVKPVTAPGERLDHSRWRGRFDEVHPNEDLIRATYAAFAAGDLQAVGESFADDIVWHSLGHSRFSRDYTGREDVFGLFGTLFEETGGTFRIELNDVLANDERAIALTTNRGERLGRTLLYEEAAVFRVADGKIAEAWLYVDDQEAHAAFFR